MIISTLKRILVVLLAALPVILFMNLLSKTEWADGIRNGSGSGHRPSPAVQETLDDSGVPGIAPQVGISGQAPLRPESGKSALALYFEPLLKAAFLIGIPALLTAGVLRLSRRFHLSSGRQGARVEKTDRLVP